MQDYQLRVCVSCGRPFVMNTVNPFPTCKQCREEDRNPVSLFWEQRRMVRSAIRRLLVKVA